MNSSVPKGPEVSSSKGEFDFSAFNTYNPQPIAPAQVSTQASGRVSLDTKPSQNPFGLDNKAAQTRASVNPQIKPTTSNDKPAGGFNNFGPATGAKSVTVQQNDPFKNFAQNTQASQGVSQPTSFNQIQGTKPQNPFAPAQTTAVKTNPFGAAPAPTKQNTSSFDAFGSFDQFGSQPVQPQKSVQDPFSQWGQTTTGQNTKPAGAGAGAGAGWDNLDSELENFSTTLARPAVVEKKSQDNFGFGFDSNQTQPTSVPVKQQQQSQPQPWESQPQPSYQQQQYQEPQQQIQHQQQEQYYQQQQHQEPYYQQQQQEPYYQQQQEQYQQQNEYQQNYDQYSGSYQNEYQQEQPHEEPQVQEKQEQREAEILSTVGANHPLRYLGSNMGLSAIRGKR